MSAADSNVGSTPSLASTLREPSACR